MRTIDSRSGLKIPPEYWVTHTPVGLRVIDYRPNTLCQAIGPFMSRTTASIKVDELDGQAQARREALLIGLAIGTVGLITAVGAALL